MRLIDADEMRQDWLENGQNEYVYDTNAVLDSIDEQPTIDAVPVVRCRDCKYHQLMENKKSFMYWHNCKLWCADISEDDFCSYGERKEGEG